MRERILAILDDYYSEYREEIADRILRDIQGSVIDLFEIQVRGAEEIIADHINELAERGKPRRRRYKGSRDPIEPSQ